MSGFVNTGMIGGTILLVVMVAAVVMVSIKKAKNANEKSRVKIILKIWILLRKYDYERKQTIFEEEPHLVLFPFIYI